MRSPLFRVGFLAALGFIAIAIWSSMPLKPGTVMLEQISAPLITTVRGTPVRSDFRIRNGMRRSLSIEGVRTGCGCAVLMSGAQDVLGRSISAGGFLNTTLNVNTANRTMGDFSIPIDVFLSDGDGARYQLHAVQRIRVNPGWAASRNRLVLCAQNDVAGTVTDEFLLSQTSPKHPFDVIHATIRRNGVRVDLHELDPQEHEHGQVIGTSPTSRWQAIPRYRVRLSIPTAAIKARETAQLALQLSHDLTRVALNVELVPAIQPLHVNPTELYLDSYAASTTREFVVSTEESLNSLRITPPLGITVISTTSLGKKLLKVNVQIDHAIWEGERIAIADGNGNHKSVVLRKAR